MKRLLRFCGSVRLAMVLLAVLIGASIAGTLIESRFDAEVAGAYVYGAGWFNLWLLLLCVNLIGAVVVRYPWKPHQIGFVMTHAGMVVIFTGALLGRLWGIEGNVTLMAGAPPENVLVINETVLQASTSGAAQARSFPLPLNLRPPRPDRPLVFRADGFAIEAVEFARELGARQVIQPGEAGPPALRLLISGETAPHPIEQWLVMDDPRRGTLGLGPHSIRFSRERETRMPSEEGASRELHYAFSKLPEMNLARLLAGHSSGARSEYQFASSAGLGELGDLILTLEGRSFVFPIREAMARPLPLEETGWTLAGLRYYADFRLEGRLPSSGSDEPRNPAVVFELIGPAHGNGAGAEGCCSSKEGVPPATRETGHELALRFEEGRLFFEGTSEGRLISGETAAGRGFDPGWPGWTFQVEELYERAVVREELAPLTGPGLRPLGASGLRVRVRHGAATDERWLMMGSTAFIPLNGDHLHVGFGYRLHPLGFSVGLERFEVEFNEGTQTPASFKSHLRFFDPSSGETLSRAVWMNNPANFPEFRGAGLLGTAYKFSQSSWNPENLDQTTLQVIRDPGWLLKWSGSLLFCAGLFTMFYLKPYPRWQKKPLAEPGAVAEEPAQAA